jgi:hypothetical protein
MFAKPNSMFAKPLLLDANGSRFPEDIVIKINTILCDEYIQKIYERLESNFIRNVIKIFLNDKEFSKFLYYLGYQTYYFNYISTPNLGIYGETLANLEWGDFECETTFDDYNGIHDDTTEPYLLHIPDEVDFYIFDATIHSRKLTLNEATWLLGNYATYDSKILHDIEECDHDTGVPATGVNDDTGVPATGVNDDTGVPATGANDDTGVPASIATFAIHPHDTYASIYDYDKEAYATQWNLFNRGYIKLNVFKIIYTYCYNTEIDNVLQKYYTMIGGTGRQPIHIDNTKLFHKTCYNIVKYFNIKIKKAVEDSITLSYIYAIYADDDGGVYFNEDHEIHENKAYDILHENGLLSKKRGDDIEILDLLYKLYLR